MIDLTTPALLFPAISLLLLAFTNRFLVLAQLIRQLHGQRRAEVAEVCRRQLDNLKKRLLLIRTMQALGVASFLTCTVTMFLVFMELNFLADCTFGLSLFLLAGSLCFSLYEIAISTKAIELELTSLEERMDD